MTCLKVIYQGRERLVEPYSLRYMQRRDGAEREYFYVYDRVGGSSGPGVKAFVAENLTSIVNTEEGFEPKFPVELCKAGELPEERYLFDSNKPAKRPGGTTKKAYGFGNPQYVYQCYHCGKRFRRKTLSPELKPHKNKNGHSCSGRHGTYVTMEC